MLILILFDVHYSQSVIFSFEKGLNGQNCSSLGSHNPIKFPLPVKFSIPPIPLSTIWKTLSFLKCKALHSKLVLPKSI